MTQTRPPNCDHLTVSIDRYLADIGAKLQFAIGSGYKQPKGKYAARVGVFKLMWEQLYGVKDLKFDHVTELDKYFAVYMKNIDHHIDNACALAKTDRATLSDNKLQLLPEIARVCHVLIRLRYLVQDFKPKQLDDYRSQMTVLMRACNELDRLFLFVNQSEINQSRQLLASFALRINTSLHAGSYKTVPLPPTRVNLDSFENFGLSDLMVVMNRLPKIDDINVHIRQFNTVIKQPKMRKQAKAQLKQDIRHLVAARDALIDFVDTLKTASVGLSKLLSTEGSMQKQHDQLDNVSGFLQTYQYALYLFGLTASQRANAQVDGLGEVVADLKRVCQTQSSAESLTVGLYATGWLEVGTCLDEIGKRLSHDLQALTKPYLIHNNDVKQLLEKIQLVERQRKEFGSLRTTLAADIARTQAVLSHAVTVLDESIATLDEHLETQFSISKTFTTRYWPNVLAGGGAGSVGAYAAMFALSQPHIYVLTAAGALLGVSLGVASGLLHHQLANTEATAVAARQQQLFDAVQLNQAQQPDAPERKPAWHSVFSLFSWRRNSASSSSSSPADDAIMRPDF